MIGTSKYAKWEIQWVRRGVIVERLRPNLDRAMRDFCGDVWNWDEYETGCEEGLYSGNLGRGIVAGEVFYSLEG